MIHLKKYFKNIWNIQKNISIFATEKISKTNKRCFAVSYILNKQIGLVQ